MMVEGEVKLEPSLRLEYAGWILSTSSLQFANRIPGDDGDLLKPQPNQLWI